MRAALTMDSFIKAISISADDSKQPLFDVKHIKRRREQYRGLIRAVAEAETEQEVCS